MTVSSPTSDPPPLVSPPALSPGLKAQAAPPVTMSPSLLPTSPLLTAGVKQSPVLFADGSPMLSPAASPAIRAIQRERAPSLTLSTCSARDLVTSREAENTIFIPGPLYAFLTSPDHTVTACMGNSTVDSPVRVIAEHLFGLENGSFQLFTGESTEDPPPTAISTNSPAKGIKGLLGRLRGRRATRERTHLSQQQEPESSCQTSDGDDECNAPKVEVDHWKSIRELSSDELDEVKRCGQWRGTEPSELFLNIYAQALLTLEKNVLNGLVSPPLMGSSGVAPLSIISHTSDIAQHYADLIVRVEHEIFFTTNVWEASEPAKKISDALRELSRRVIERGGDQVIVKIMYDRGEAHHDNGPSPYIYSAAHLRVEPAVYSSPSVGLPSPDELPGVRLEVQNYHIPPVGSFHQKSVVFDRKIALLSSNNVQNRDDVGFMVQLEGPIVQSIYDTAILAWWTTFSPPLPLLSYKPEYPAKISKDMFIFGKEQPEVESKGDLDEMAQRTLKRLAIDDVSQTSLESSVADGDAAEGEAASLPALQLFNPLLLHDPHDPFPIALVNRTPRGRKGQGDTYVPQNQAWLSSFKFAKHSVFLQTPTFSAKPVVAAALDAVRRGVLVEIYADLGFNQQGEISHDGRSNMAVAVHMYSQLTDAQKDFLKIAWYTPKGQTSPVGARGSAHTCHIKLMIIDGSIAIQGNGDQNASSWYHSQEINILVDSPTVCTDWRTRIDANQSTATVGLVGPDGIWRDAEGKQLPVPASASVPGTPATNPSSAASPLASGSTTPAIAVPTGVSGLLRRSSSRASHGRSPARAGSGVFSNVAAAIVGDGPVTPGRSSPVSHVPLLKRLNSKKGQVGGTAA